MIEKAGILDKNPNLDFELIPSKSTFLGQEDKIFSKLLAQADIDAELEKIREEKRCDAALRRLKDQLKRIERPNCDLFLK